MIPVALARVADVRQELPLKHSVTAATQVVPDVKRQFLAGMAAHVDAKEVLELRVERLLARLEITLGSRRSW